jgi:hypothetical protein
MRGVFQIEVCSNERWVKNELKQRKFAIYAHSVSFAQGHYIPVFSQFSTIFTQFSAKFPQARGTPAHGSTQMKNNNLYTIKRWWDGKT